MLYKKGLRWMIPVDLFTDNQTVQIDGKPIWEFENQMNLGIKLSHRNTVQKDSSLQMISNLKRGKDEETEVHSKVSWKGPGEQPILTFRSRWKYRREHAIK